MKFPQFISPKAKSVPIDGHYHPFTMMGFAKSCLDDIFDNDFVHYCFARKESSLPLMMRLKKPLNQTLENVRNNKQKNHI